jgi:multiple sugar transport system substrate-binding protein
MSTQLPVIRRSLIFGLVFTLALALLVACTPGEPAETPLEPPVDTPAEPGETPDLPPTDEELQGTLRVAVVRGAMDETVRQLASQFTQRHLGVNVTVEEEPEGGAFEALIAAGNQPDLIVVSFGPQAGRFADQGAVVPLDDLPGFQELIDRLEPATVQEIYGANYYIPIGADVTMMIYNKELFEEAGLDPEDPPTTWAEFLTAAEAIHSLPSREGGEQVYGTLFWNEALAWGGWYWNMLQPIYLNANQGQCQLLNRLGTDIVFDQEQCKLADFFEFTRQAQQYAPPTMERNFFSRTIGMWPQYGYSWEPNLREAAGQPMVIGEDVGVAPVPVPNEGDTPYTTYGGRGLMIMRTTPEREALAWEFVRFLMEDENNLVFITELGYLPTLLSLQDDPYFKDLARQPFVEALQHGLLPEQIGAADQVAVELLGVYQQTVVEGRLEPEQAVQEAAQRARGHLR